MMEPSHNPSSRINGPVAAALAAWLGVQLIALGLGASRVMWWAHAPVAGEQLALIVMLAAQVAMAAVLFPVLMQNVRSTLLAIAVAWPMAELASFLADAPASKLFAGEIFVSAWLATLYVWAKAIEKQNSSTKVLAAAIAVMISVGGPLLWYLRVEFGDTGAVIPWSRTAMFGPVLGAISQILPDRAIGSAWDPVIILFGIGALSCVGKRINRGFSRQVIH